MAKLNIHISICQINKMCIDIYQMNLKYIYINSIYRHCYPLIFTKILIKYIKYE